MSTCDQICDSVWELNEIFFSIKRPYPLWGMKKYTKDKNDDFLQEEEKDARSFMYPFRVPTLKRTEEITNMFYRSKVMHVNKFLSWTTYICVSHFSDETGIYPFCSLKSERNTGMYELNKTLYYLGMKLYNEDASGDWKTFAIFVYFKLQRLMVTFDMSAVCPYICVQVREEYGNRCWKPYYYFFATKSWDE